MTVETQGREGNKARIAWVGGFWGGQMLRGEESLCGGPRAREGESLGFGTRGRIIEKKREPSRWSRREPDRVAYGIVNCGWGGPL